MWLQRVRHVFCQKESFFAQFNWGFNQVLPRQRSKALMQFPVTHHFAWRSNWQRAQHIVPSRFVQIIFGRCRTRFFGIQGVCLLLAALVDIHYETATEAHALHSQNAIAKQRGQRGIRHILTFLEDVPAKSMKTYVDQSLEAKISTLFWLTCQFCCIQQHPNTLHHLWIDAVPTVTAAMDIPDLVYFVYFDYWYLIDFGYPRLDCL